MTDTPSAPELAAADLSLARAIWEEGHERIAGQAEDASYIAEQAHIQVMAEHLARYRLNTRLAPASDPALDIYDRVWSKPEYASADRAYTAALTEDPNDQMSALASAVDAAIAQALAPQAEPTLDQLREKAMAARERLEEASLKASPMPDLAPRERAADRLTMAQLEGSEPTCGHGTPWPWACEECERADPMPTNYDPLAAQPPRDQGAETAGDDYAGNRPQDYEVTYTDKGLCGWLRGRSTDAGIAGDQLADNLLRQAARRIEALAIQPPRAEGAETAGDLLPAALQRLADYAKMIAELEAKLATQPPAPSPDARAAALEEAVDKARVTFLRYATLHFDKRTEVGKRKALANMDLAAEMQRALASQPAAVAQDDGHDGQGE